MLVPAPQPSLSARRAILSKVTIRREAPEYLALIAQTGKVVTRLDYQAYTKLALKTMDNILAAARQSVSSVLHIAVYHRLGTVPVGEPSIVIAVSSPHRKEAFVACELVLEEVKRRAQIWKREFYEGEPDEAAQWKENH